MDFLAELGGQPRQVEDVDRKTLLGENRFGQFYQPPGFRHLAWAGVLAARRTVDQQDAWRFAGIIVTALRGEDGVARGQPVDRDVIVGIGKARPALRVTGAFRELA